MMEASSTFLTNSATQFLGFLPHLHRSLSSSSSSVTLSTLPQRYPRVCCRGSSNPNHRRRERVKLKREENVWSIDNEAAKMAEMKEKKKERRRQMRSSRTTKKGRKGDGSIMVSGNMLMETEEVLQTQEPVILPAWNTFVSSVSGIWKGVGAAFSPTTAEMEPIDIGRNNENQFDCYTLSRIEAVPSTSGGQRSSIQMTVNWVTLNPHGENRQLQTDIKNSKEKFEHDAASSSSNKTLHGNMTNNVLPKFESFDFEASDVMEEDVMDMEPGLVFFEDGSYSRGPVEIPVEASTTEYYLPPTFKFEQCLVKGCHKRLRIVHTIEFGDGCSDVQILRVAVYEEQWVSTANLPDKSSDVEFNMKPFSQRRRVQPSELTGSWKVFETSATPIFGGETITEEGSDNAPYVYLCTETLKKRSLPDNTVYFGEEEVLDMADVTMLWLPGGVTGYVDVNNDGILCIGVGWYSDEGINLVMERDYGMDGKLKEVRSKTEVKRRWTDPLPLDGGLIS